MDKADLPGALLDSLRSNDLKSLAGDYAEIGVDALLVDGVLKDIPIVNTVRALAKAGFAVRDRLLIQKLIKFLGPLQKIDPQLRREVIEDLESDPVYGRRVGEHLIELLDRIDSHLKPEMLARTFKAYAEGEIDADMFHRLNYAIERLPWFEVPDIRRFYEMPPPERFATMNKNTLSDFASAGLATPASAYGGIAYEPNSVCEAFLRLDLDRVAT
jgi:hypothetical protein